VPNKPGWKTSEFALSLFAASLPLINRAFNIDLPTETIVSAVGAVVAYTLSRGWVKKEAVKNVRG
jgi:hypothetical protein